MRSSPSLLLPSRSRSHRLPRVRPHLLLHLDMAHPPRPRPGKRVASWDTIFLSSPMERCAVQQAARSRSRSGDKRLMEACGWCMPEASADLVPVSYVSSANGMGTPPKSRARSACSCIRSASGVSRFSGMTGVVEYIDTPVSTSSVLNASRCTCTLLAQILPLLPSLLHSFLVRNVPIRACPGTNDSFATPAPRARSNRQSPCSACQMRLRPSSACGHPRTAARGRRS